MKQKYTVLKNDEKNELVIREYAELDKEIFSLLCEEIYNGDVVKSAIKKSKESLISALRTQNLYPPGIYMDKIADAAVSLYESADMNQHPLDILFNDINFLTKEPREPEIPEEEIEEEPVVADDLDDLLEDDIDDIEDDFDDKSSIDPINSPLKIADDESLDIEDET